MFIRITPLNCDIQNKNHYIGYGNVKTRDGKEIYIKGAPRLYQRKGLIGSCLDEAIEDGNNKKSATLLRELFKEPDVNQWGNLLAGNYCIAIIDRQKSLCFVITDLGNAYHLYQARTKNNQEVLISPDIDSVAKETGRLSDIDYVSLVEYLTNVSISYPYTFYQEITEVPYASCCTFRYNVPQIQTSTYHYWVPRCLESESSDDIGQLAKKLREDILQTAEDILADKQNVGLFLSGGMDSRVLAGIMKHLGKSGTAITFADTSNYETEIAKRVAEANGLRHELIVRDNEYYPRLIADYLSMEGPHGTFTRALDFGFRDRITAYQFDALLGGYMSDTLLKLHEANVRGKYFFGRHLGTLATFDRTLIVSLRGGDVYLKQFSHIFREELIEAVVARRKTIMEYWYNLRKDGSAWEWSYMWPFSRNQHNQNLTVHISNYQAFELLTERCIIEVARIASQRIKMNGRLFNSAMYPFLQSSAHIPIAVTGLRMRRPWRWNEMLIALKHLLPRRWMFRHAFSRNPQNAGSITTYTNARSLWKESELLEAYRGEYDASALEQEIMQPSVYSAFSFERYGSLPKKYVYHIMYTLLHLDRWNKRRVMLS